jgi:hypothetical protein
MRLIRFAFLLPLVVASCVEPPTPQPRAAPPVALRPMTPPSPPAAPSADWTQRTPAPGTWTYTRDARGSLAMYGQAGGNALFTLRCDRKGNRIYASRAGTVAARMTLRSTNGAKGYDALPTGSQPPYLAAELAARDPQLDAMAFSRGRILIGLDGASDIILPIWPEFTRVVEDCRG